MASFSPPRITEFVLGSGITTKPRPPRFDLPLPSSANTTSMIGCNAATNSSGVMFLQATNTGLSASISTSNSLTSRCTCSTASVVPKATSVLVRESCTRMRLSAASESTALAALATLLGAGRDRPVGTPSNSGRISDRISSTGPFTIGMSTGSESGPKSMSMNASISLTASICLGTARMMITF